MCARIIDRTGEKGISNEGYSMEIVAYRGNTDIDVLIDGKYLRRHRTYGDFQRGKIASRSNGVRESRLGESSVSKEGYSMKIVAYRKADDIDVVVDGYHLVERTSYTYFKNGSISNPYHRATYGLGYRGVGKYRSKEDGKITAMYNSWHKMFVRCYDKRYLTEKSTYTGCEVDERFHNFQDFGVWYVENYYTVGSEVMHLDKDIMVKGNKVYSPDTCVFVPSRINMLIINNKRSRGKYPVGVLKTGKRYTAELRVNKHTSGWLGTFDTPEEAFLAYKTAKEAYIKEVADEYKDKIPKKLYDALYAYTIEITD